MSQIYCRLDIYISVFANKYCMHRTRTLCYEWLIANYHVQWNSKQDKRKHLIYEIHHFRIVNIDKSKYNEKHNATLTVTTRFLACISNITYLYLSRL